MARQRRLWQQLWPSYAAVSFISISAVAWYAVGQLREYYFRQTVRELEEKALMASRVIQPLFVRENFAEVDALCKELAKDVSTRISVIAHDGTVAGDSELAPEKMENHSDRQEVIQALLGRPGTATRYSASLGRQMVYVALPLFGAGGKPIGVVRTSASMAMLKEILAPGLRRFVFAAALVALMAVAAGFAVSRRLCRPLDEMRLGLENFTRGKPDFRVPIQASTELAVLAEAMNRLMNELNRQLDALARRYNEQEALMNGMLEGVLAVDRDGRISALNNAAARLLGVERSRALGRMLREEVRGTELNRFVESILSGPSPAEAEIVLCAPQEEEKNIQLRGVELKDGSGRRVGAIVVLNDITRLKRLEKIRKDFVANVSHELRTPLTAIAGFVSTLQDGAMDDPGRARHFLEIISRHAARLNNIIDDLLCLSRIEHDAENRAIAFESCAICELLQAAAQARGQQALKKNIRLKVVCRPELRAKANAALLEHAIVNLVDNAIKYSPAGAPVRISASLAGGEIRIKVADRGCGIASEHLPRLFERFYRADKARSQKDGGTGLGLAIVKHIAVSHGGTAEVKSRPGKGSVFLVRFPSGL